MKTYKLFFNGIFHSEYPSSYEAFKAAANLEYNNNGGVAKFDTDHGCSMTTDEYSRFERDMMSKFFIVQ